MVVAHEVGHVLGLETPVYTGSLTVWQPDPNKDGIIGWERPDTIPCWKQWFDLKQGPPDRFSHEHIRDLRESAGD